MATIAPQTITAVPTMAAGDPVPISVATIRLLSACHSAAHGMP